ncbi:hypothetical protein AAMO2058_001129400 [Amorphochlora amoebiformis]
MLLSQLRKRIREDRWVTERMDARGRTPLMLAAGYGSAEAVRFLIEEAGAQVSKRDYDGHTAMLYAGRLGNLQVVDYLLGWYQRQVESKHKTALETSNPDDRAAYAKFSRLARSIIHGTFTYSAKSGNLEIVKLLAEAHDARFIEQRDHSTGNTALIESSSRGKLDIVKYLIENKHANPHRKSANGLTALRAACSSGKVEVLRYLIRRGKENGYDVFHGSHPSIELVCACKHGHTNVISLLVLDAKAQVNMRNLEGETALLAAARAGHSSVVQLLVTMKAQVTQTDSKGMTALEVAKEGKKRDIEKILQNAMLNGESNEVTNTVESMSSQGKGGNDEDVGKSSSRTRKRIENHTRATEMSGRSNKRKK